METTDRPESLDALPNFLVEHDGCGKGFDVDHPAGLGAGVIGMTCRSCGGRFEFVPTTVEVEREIQLEPLDRGEAIELDSRPAASVRPPEQPAMATPAEPAPSPSLRPATDPNGGRGGVQAPRKRRSSRSRRDRIVVVVLLVFAIAAFAFAIFRVINEREGSGEAEPAPQPAQATAPAAEPPAETQLQLTASSITVPTGWTQSSAGGETTIAPPGRSPVSIQFFDSQNPGLGTAELISGTRNFLSSEAPDGAAGPVRRTTVAGDPAFELTESGPGGSQEALGVLSGPHRFLLVGTALAGASAAEKADLRGALGSFRPN